MPATRGAALRTAWPAQTKRHPAIALSRARDDLHIILPRRFFVHDQPAQGDRRVHASRTRFVPKGLLDLFERRSWSAAMAVMAATAAPQPIRVDVGERLRGLWR